MVDQNIRGFSEEIRRRLDLLTSSMVAGEFDGAVDILAESVRRGGVVQAYGTGHSEAFAMEIAGRAGGLIPTNKVSLRDTVLWGTRQADELLGFPPLERSASIAEELFGTIRRQPEDAFIIASNSGVNGSVVGMALLAKEHGHPLIAVTSLEHTARVEPAHPSGLRLRDVADVVIDNLAPFGDTVLESPVGVGAVSSITSAYIAQLLTIGVVTALAADGGAVPVFLSANVPGGDDHNHRFEELYGDRIRRVA